MNLRRFKLFGFGLVGLAGTVVAGVLVFAPDALGGLLPTLRQATEMVDPLWVGALVGVVGLLTAWHVGHGGRRTTSFDSAVETPPESVTAEETPLSGAGLDERYESAVADEPGAMDALVDRLRATAVTTYALEAEVARERATRAVADGEWTDDTVAAALLSPDRPQPLVARLRLWLDPESERERRVKRTVSAIDDLRRGPS
ncbi:DUF7269 family protein [Haloarcula salinisoli]|uniref:DUF7269 family protein n=1 Tax=Haloarcula salinisoli TaxID=2487746 RepID=UPI002E2DD16E|nr:hypothetical protein [Halomicroarcula salinisoli]